MYVVPKKERIGFYEFFQKGYEKLSRRLDMVENDVLTLHREMNLLKSRYSEVEPQSLKSKFLIERYADMSYRDLRRLKPSRTSAPFVSSLLKEYTSHLYERVQSQKEIESTITKRIYLPLASTSIVLSIFLLVAILVVTGTPLLALPFVLSTAFSIYYYAEKKKAL